MSITDQTLKTIGKYLVISSAVAGGLYLCYFFIDIILILILSILLGMIINPLVNILERRGIGRLFSVVIVFLLLGVIFILGMSFFIPMIISQMNTIAGTLTQENVSQVLVQIGDGIKNYIPFLDSSKLTEQLSTGISNILFNSFDDVSNLVSEIFSVLSISVIIPFITFFLVKDHTQISKGLISIIPNRYFEMSYSVLKKINYQLGKYVRSWILDAIFVAILSAIGLTILGIKNSITIGIIAGIGHLIPFFGPIIGGLPAILISIIQFGDFSMLPAIIIMFVIIYTIDNGFIQPNIFSKSTDLHPLAIILLIIAGSKVMGIFGMLLAVPIATVCKTAIKEIYFGFKNYKIIKHR